MEQEMPRDTKRVTKEIKSSVFDGERKVSDSRITEARLPSEPDFVKFYTDDVANLNGIKGHQRDVLAFMAASMGYDNVAVVSPPQRRRWAEQLEVSMSTINNAISKLMRAGHITSKEQGEYTVDPNLYAKGEWRDTIKKQENFDAHFIVSYEKTKAGYKRTFREAKISPIGTKVDLETGELLYKYKRGGEWEPKRHNDSTVTEHNQDGEDN